jgi:hypothetical protein
VDAGPELQMAGGVLAVDAHPVGIGPAVRVAVGGADADVITSPGAIRTVPNMTGATAMRRTNWLGPSYPSSSPRRSSISPPRGCCAPASPSG